ncbi:MAG TPA: hypothetical protein VGE07_26775 [Herpetosiphonaceae bacterium]
MSDQQQPAEEQGFFDKVLDGAKDLAEKAGEFLGDAAEKVGEVASDVAHAVSEAAENVAEKVGLAKPDDEPAAADAAPASEGDTPAA